MTSREGLCSLPAVEAVRAMREGSLRAEDYCRALLDRAGQWKHLNAFISIDGEQVLEAARAADRSRAAGGAMGLLHGLPLPVKDSVNTRALPTTNGTPSLRVFRPREDAQVLRRLFAEGAILMGKTNLQELSRGWTSNNLAFGAVRNPHDAGRVPGGSSGGSAAAVAAGIAPIAVAEDTWGSIRVPAAFCGVVGFRPTHGRHPNGGIMPLTLDRFDQVGPVARSVADVALFDACATRDARPLEEASLSGVRLGVPVHMLEGMDPDVEAIVGEAFDRLEDAGADLIGCELPPVMLAAPEIATAVIAGENVRAITAFLAEHDAGVGIAELLDQLSPNIRSRYEVPPPPPEAYRKALADRDRLMDATARLFDRLRIAALAFPPCIAAAPPLGDNAEVLVGGRLLPLRIVVGRNTALGPCARLASLVLPAGFTPSGLPVALEFDAPAGADRRLLALGAALERVLPRLPEIGDVPRS